MSWTILTRRAYRSLFLLISVLAITGLIVTSSQAMQGMAPQKQPPPQQARPGPGIIDWGRALGPLLMPQPGPMIYPGEPLQPPENIDLLWPTDPGSGSVPPVEIPKLPPQQEPTPTVKPSTSQTLGLTGGNTPMVLGAPVTAIPPGTNLGQTPDDLLNKNPGNTQMPPGNEIAGMPPTGPDIQWPSPVGPDQDAIDAGRELLAKQRREEAEAAARKAEEDARRAREAAAAVIQKAQEMKQQAQQAIDDMQKKAQQAIDDMQKKAEQAIKDAATDAAIAEIDKLTQAADKANQQKQAAADAARKAQEQKAKQERWAQENEKAWKEHQAKEQKAQQEAQAQEQAKQQQQAQQAQQAQQQKQATQQFQQQQQQDLDSRDTKIRKALGGGP